MQRQTTLSGANVCLLQIQCISGGWSSSTTGAVLSIVFFPGLLFIITIFTITIMKPETCPIDISKEMVHKFGKLGPKREQSDTKCDNDKEKAGAKKRMKKAAAGE